MADDKRREQERNPGAEDGREEWGSGPGGGQRGESFRQGASADPAQGRGGYEQGGQSYGQAGGYNQGPGQSYGGFGSDQAGPGHGQSGSGGGQGYTDQTGTGYGQTAGGDSPEEGLWDKARHAVSGVFGSGDQPHGQHRGRGPKGYSRSDERIHDDVNDRLTDDPFLDATHIEVVVLGGEVTLSGTVTARADKRRAEDLADNVSGVKHVQNNLRVEEVGSEGSR
ncbi:MAG: BON domain-containing protein [Pseudomonadota bacterium]|nr:BON domain-containing protein [Pseudomonadota bacterium]